MDKSLPVGIGSYDLLIAPSFAVVPAMKLVLLSRTAYILSFLSPLVYVKFCFLLVWKVGHNKTIMDFLIY